MDKGNRGDRRWGKANEQQRRQPPSDLPSLMKHLPRRHRPRSGFVVSLRAVLHRRAPATAETESDAVWSTQGGARDSKWASGAPRRVVTAGLQPARVVRCAPLAGRPFFSVLAGACQFGTAWAGLRLIHHGHAASESPDDRKGGIWWVLTANIFGHRRYDSDRKRFQSNRAGPCIPSIAPSPSWRHLIQSIQSIVELHGKQE